MYKRERGDPLGYREHAVPDAASSYVRAIWNLSLADAGEGAAPIAPDGCVELIFNLGDAIAEDLQGILKPQPSAFLIGQLLRPVQVVATGRVEVWGIRLQPWAVLGLLGVSGRELRDRILPIDDVTRPLQELHDRIRSCAPQERATQLVRSVDLLVADARAIAASAPALVRWAMAMREASTVGLLARSAGLSVRRVQRVFDDHVGLAPKSLMRLSRFQRALFLLRSGRRLRISEIAARCGYHDQAHFVRECHQFLGMAPVAALKRPAHVGDSFIPAADDDR